MEESYLSSEGQLYYNYSSSSDEEVEKKQPAISKFRQLINEIDSVYETFKDWDARKEKLQQILERSDLTTKSVNKYTHWDLSKSYTRNLCHSTDEYTLLILCWSPSKESKIHNHPSQSCFIKTLRGCIREVVYNPDLDTDSLVPVRTRFYNEGQVSWMSDSVGLHKIGNPCPESGSVTLHLYTPPFSECKVWNSSKDKASKFEVAKMGFFSVMGLRTPQLEGKKGNFALLMQELKNATSTQSTLTSSTSSESFVESDDGRSYECDDDIEEIFYEDELTGPPYRCQGNIA
jgi:cysteine dioxygenase